MSENIVRYKTEATQESIEAISAEKWAKIHKMRKSIYASCSGYPSHDLAEQAVETLYVNAGLQKPKVVFYRSPREGALKVKALQRETHLGPNIGDYLSDGICEMGEPFWDAIYNAVSGDDLMFSLGVILEDKLEASFWDSLWVSIKDSLRRIGLADDVASLYYEKARLGYFLGGEIAGVHYDSQSWEKYKLVAGTLDVILAFREICIVCDRPIKIDWGKLGEVHYADGFSLQKSKP
jgi:hypothetical protein